MRIRSLALLLAAVAGPMALARPAAGAPVPPLDHVIVIIMENKNWSQVRSTPYVASLRQSGAELTNSYGVSLAASQPNYLALWAGTTFGVTNNNCPPAGAPYAVENLGHALEAAGKTWRAYSEDLPAAGSSICATPGGSPLYTRKHEPWTNFSNLDHNNERPYTDLATDIANNQLPNLAFVIPNNCNNSHNTGCTTLVADAWLANNMPAMLDAVGVDGIVILTWDEDNGTAGNNNHILTVFSGRRVLYGSISPGVVDHYGVLRTICDGLGIAPMGAAATATPITDIWFEGDVGVLPTARGDLWLSPPQPNPSRGGVSARLWLPEPGVVDAGVYDIAGHAVRTLARGTHAGAVDLAWDGRREDGTSVGAGIYFFKVRVGARVLRQKAVLLR